MLFRVELRAERRLAHDGEESRLDREVVHCGKEVDVRIYWTEFVFRDDDPQSAAKAAENFCIAHLHSFFEVDISLQGGTKGADGRFASKQPPEKWTLRLE